ncbi:hypothetical protein [Myxacorys almedinensis]|uniref:Uncharacterized protein n=1 Tax=Myxacorys almedinensis A TaxID=2690445 RepID=A0A8J7Z9Y8_9CYAN|nr:hypothetical protein [Myxacorys almedinensis]NDJ18120.1 hypothetical protein [Myxacorys almedinensis A]
MAQVSPLRFNSLTWSRYQDTWYQNLLPTQQISQSFSSGWLFCDRNLAEFGNGGCCGVVSCPNRTMWVNYL